MPTLCDSFVLWPPFQFRLDLGDSPEVEAQTRFAAPPFEIPFLVEYPDQGCRVLHLDEDGSPVSQRGEWDHIPQWHPSQPAAESILVVGSVSDFENPEYFCLHSYYLTASRMIWNKVRHLYHF